MHVSVSPAFRSECRLILHHVSLAQPPCQVYRPPRLGPGGGRCVYKYQVLFYNAPPAPPMQIKRRVGIFLLWAACVGSPGVPCAFQSVHRRTLSLSATTHWLHPQGSHASR
jgi:hypothetical protein